jgi:small subunit ribosomal protein S1
MAGFDACMTEQRERARAHAEQDAWGTFNDVWVALSDKLPETEFLGYEVEQVEAARVLALVVDGAEADFVGQGDEVDVEILSVDSENQKIALGIRQTQANPWDSVQDRYPVGGRVKGKVRNFTTYGAFIELEEGIDGMIHVSDMSWTRKINHPSECLEKGKEVEAIILDVNPKEQRISLGLKQASQDPWADIASKYKVGALVKGKVSKIASFGAFIELEDGVDGLVHISQISDQRVDKVKDALQAGQEVEARVVKVDRGERRIGLSIRAVTMTEEELKALEAEAAAEPAEGEASGLGGGESFGGLGAAFDEAFQNVEWQPGEAN